MWFVDCSCSMHDAAVSSGDFACKSTTDETFSVVNKSLSVYPSKGNDNCNISTMVQQTRLACNIACIHVFPSLHVVISWTHTCSCNWSQTRNLCTIDSFFPLLLIFWFGVNQIFRVQSHTKCVKLRNQFDIMNVQVEVEWSWLMPSLPYLK